MNLKSRLDDLASKFKNLQEEINTEEATKTAFILPFIASLGYDIFNPREVIPEYIADVGLKKGEKVDYAILNNGKPCMIFECKHWKETLDDHTSQLHRYFSVSKCKFGVLTNGNEYRFYTDLVKPNIMDSKPFLTFELDKTRDSQIAEISKFHKSKFDEDKISLNATSLKLTNEIKNVFHKELENPSDDFARFFASKIVNGIMTRKIVSQFVELVPIGINQMINEKINDRLQNAINKEAENIDVIVEEEESKINTTEEEMDGFRIVIAILRRSVPIDRIAYRDTQSYFGILLDDNNRKPICRLHFDGKVKYIGLFDKEKKETRFPIQTIEDIYKYDTVLIESINNYDKT